MTPAPARRVQTVSICCHGSLIVGVLTYRCIYRSLPLPSHGVALGVNGYAASSASEDYTILLKADSNRSVEQRHFIIQDRIQDIKLKMSFNL